MRAAAHHAGCISLAKLLPAARFVGAPDVCVTSCTSDSRSCLPGDLFAALVGSTHDGHEFARHALARGAAAVLCERPLPVYGVPQCIVADSREAYGRVCQALAGEPSQRLKVIGVTGTSGKTTTGWLIGSVLRAAGCRAAVMGTLGASDGAGTTSGSPAACQSHTMAAWLRRSESNGCTHAVLEVSSRELSQRRTAGIAFDAACLTNVRRHHLDFHGSLANYRKAKGRLLEQVSGEGFVVLNADDPASAGYLTEFHGPILTYGLKSAAEVTASVIERHASEQLFLLTVGSHSAAVRTRMIGDHHVQNCLAAATVGLAYGIELGDVVRGLEAIESIPGRLERIECGQPFGVFVDGAHTPDAMAGILRTLRQVTDGRLICVFGGRGMRDRGQRSHLGRAVACGADLAVLTDEPFYSEDAHAALGDVSTGCEPPQAVQVIPDRAHAIAWALAAAVPGDCVLINGQASDDDGGPGRRGRTFDDRQLVRDFLYHAAQCELPVG
jgi:UDP-N-acetylmuramoyl-L-alanyl-D-glutamate--2,6-diaminopimelate ligase